MEKIEIKDFLDIKDICIEVKQINILIGKQASGKSVIAKLLYYFKSFVFEIISAAEQSKTKEQLDNNYKNKFREYFPSSSWNKKDFQLQYSIEKEFIKLQSIKSEIHFNYSQLYEEIFDDMRLGIEAWSKQDAAFLFPIIPPHEVRIQFLSNFRKNTHNSLKFGQIYIPAGRSFFANLKKNIFSLLATDNTIEPILIEFGHRYEILKSKIESQAFLKNIDDKNLHNEIEKISYRIIGGKYLQKNGEDYLALEGEREVSMTKSSSGQQETLPLTLFLAMIARNQSSTEGISVYIEEPESHIFPESQKDIVELISIVYNAQKDSSQFFITTHSPYILTAFNNLLQAGMLALNASEEKLIEIEKLVPKSRFLNPEEISVYSVENGYCKSIINEETGLIDANVIDEVSNELAVQFDQLLDLEE